VSEEECLDALGVKLDFYLIVLRHLVVIDAQHRAGPEDAMRDAVVLLPGRGDGRGLIGDW